jgi:ferrous iron transport protein B
MFFRLIKTILKDLKKLSPTNRFTNLWLVITQDVNFAKCRAKKSRRVRVALLRNQSHILKDYNKKKRLSDISLSIIVLKEAYHVDPEKASDLRSKLDRILIHKFWGYLIFF